MWTTVTPKRSNEDMAMAQDWTSKAMGARKSNEAKKNQGPGGITLDDTGQMH